MAQIFKDLVYVEGGSSVVQTLDLFIPASSQPSSLPLLVFVHGGAWRSGDKTNLYPFANHVIEDGTCAVALLNYRLTSKTTPLRHPGHCEDVLAALEFLVSSNESASFTGLFDPKQVHLAGHSCGTHILTSIFMLPTHTIAEPSQTLLRAVQTISLSEGLHDLDLLLTTFPSYRSFVAPVFGDLESFHPFSPVNYGLREGGKHIQWLVIHSTGDGLVDTAQSEVFFKHLESLSVTPAKQWDTLDGNHDEILAWSSYAHLITSFVKRAH